MTTPLKWRTKLAYGCGHVMNDLQSAVWFTYLIYFFTTILGFESAVAGYMLLWGQVVDGLSTLFVGYNSDHTQHGFLKYGRRKSWHLVGSILCALAFPMIFNRCIICTGTTVNTDHARRGLDIRSYSCPVTTCSKISRDATARYAQFIYYMPFVAMFQFGWACVQISHLSLIPELTSSEEEKVELNGIIYAATVTSNIISYSVLFAFIGIQDTHGGNLTPSNIPATMLGPRDVDKFFYSALIIVGIGLLTNIIFHTFTKERSQLERAISETREILWHQWLRERNFWLLAIIYLSTRLLLNINQVYMPLLISRVLKLPKVYIAVGPMAYFVCSAATGFLMRPLNSCLNKKTLFAIGSVLIVGASIDNHFLCVTPNCVKTAPSEAYWVFLPLCVMGVGGTFALVTSLSLIADLIGTDSASGAFVYGMMSFTDKITTGVVAAILQLKDPCLVCPGAVVYYENILTYLPIAAIVTAFVAVMVAKPVTSFSTLPFSEDTFLSDDSDSSEERRGLQAGERTRETDWRIRLDVG